MSFVYLVPHPCCLNEADFLSQCEFTFLRRGGPGGQHRNKVSSAVVVCHQATSIVAESNERRDQHQNRRVAIARLRIQLAWLVRGYEFSANVKPESERRGSPESGSVSELWSQRMLDARGVISADHWDFATILAEALDVFFQQEMEVSSAASLKQITSAQFVKLLRIDRNTLAWVNQQRQKSGFPQLK